jgi:hypothetical protein
MSALIRTFAERGDLAHLALLLWALSASALTWFALRALLRMPRFDDFVPDVTCGRELLSLLRAGAIDGLSIGFRTAKARIDPRMRIRRIYVVDLWEISIVTFPMLDGCTRAQREACASRKFAHRRPDSLSANYRAPRNPKSSMTRFL